ncbi:MAG: hypothetical protein A2081_04895 [Elusimicrobia bacterium GWC2_61_19]|nr:MAG: hypothetical protein A2081_04895 [Elusimicrobia bacterium GWC2_61_19]
MTLAAGTGEARALMALNSYDLLITDMDLGDGFGTELIEIAYAGADSRTKVIMVTGSLEEPELRDVAAKYRLPGYFGKPFSVDALLTTVRNVLALPE